MLIWMGSFSVIIYIVARIIVLFYQKKNDNQDNPVFVISLQQKEIPEVNRSRNHTTGGTQRANTERYNPIMFPLDSMMYLIIVIVMVTALISLGSLGLSNPHFLLEYVRDFFPGLLCRTLMPLIFYARHAKARNFIV